MICPETGRNCLCQDYCEVQDREGIFRAHRCWKCDDGRHLDRCPTPHRPGNCGYPRARND